jgi:hypothetical protein
VNGTHWMTRIPWLCRFLYGNLVIPILTLFIVTYMPASFFFLVSECKQSYTLIQLVIYILVTIYLNSFKFQLIGYALSTVFGLIISVARYKNQDYSSFIYLFCPTESMDGSRSCYWHSCTDEADLVHQLPQDVA